MTLSIIITHYKTPKLLIRCVESIIRFLKSIDYEIIVADSVGESSTQALLKKKFSSKSIIIYLGFKENVGYGYLVNRGLEKAKGSLIFIMNADIFLRDEHSILVLLDYLKKHPDVGLIGGKLINPDGSIEQSYFREPTLGAIVARRTAWRHTSWGKRALDRYEFKDYNGAKPLEVDWLMGSCLLTKREALAKVGLLDQRFFMYFEDVDWAKRFRKQEYNVIYHPQAEFTNYQKGVSKGSGGILDVFFNYYTRIHIKSLLKYLLKWKAGL